MEDKFKRVMDHGTPRLVTKNRQLNMDTGSMKSRQLLLGIANVRTNDKVDDKSILGKKGPSFAKASVANFRQKMLMEEKESEMEEMKQKQEEAKASANA